MLKNAESAKLHPKGKFRHHMQDLLTLGQLLCCRATWISSHACVDAGWRKFDTLEEDEHAFSC
jgi:hypothetical protein